LGEILEYSWLAVTVLLFVWAARLVGAGLARTYPILASFLLLSIVQQLLGLFLYRSEQFGSSSDVYAQFWFVSRVVTFTLYFCILAEISNRMLKGYQGFQSLGRLVMYAGLSGIFVLVMAMIVVSPSHDPRTLWFVEERTLFFGLTLVFLLLVSFAAYFHLTPPRNIRILFAVFGLLFTSEVALQTLQEYFGYPRPSGFDVARQLVHVGCFLAGAIAFSRVGEEQPAALPWLNVDEETVTELTQQLESYNDTLMKVLRS